MNRQIKPRKGYKLVNSFFGRYERIPEEWNYETIEDCCKVLDSNRIPLNSNERKKIQGNIPYYGANGILDHIDQNIFDEDLVLLAEDGGYFSEYQTKPIAQFVTGKSWVNNHAHVLANKSNYNLKFIFYSLVHKNIMIWISGSTRTKLNQSELRRIKILIPTSKVEQQKIASILSGVDALIESTQKLIEKTENLKKGLMQQLLLRGIGHTKFKVSKFGKIPYSWNIAHFEKFVKIISGSYFPFTKFAEKGIPVLKIDNVVHGQIDWTTTTYLPKEYLDSKDVIVLKQNDIVLALNRPITHNKIKIAKLGKNDSPSILYQRVGKFEFQNKYEIAQNYFFIVMSSSIFKLILEKILVGSDQPYVKTTELLKQKFPYPTDITEQTKIASILSGVDAYIQKNQQYKERLEKLKKGLMQKLLTGQIRVKV